MVTYIALVASVFIDLSVICFLMLFLFSQHTHIHTYMTCTTKIAHLAQAADRGDKWFRPDGIYAAVIGPSYETPAESRFLRSVGGDCVGMSTIPEVLAARHAGMKVLGLSLISNKVVTSHHETPASHTEVLEAVNLRVSQLPEIVRELVVRMGKHFAESNDTSK